MRKMKAKLLKEKDIFASNHYHMPWSGSICRIVFTLARTGSKFDYIIQVPGLRARAAHPHCELFDTNARSGPSTEANRFVVCSKRVLKPSRFTLARKSLKLSTATMPFSQDPMRTFRLSRTWARHPLLAIVLTI